MVNFEFAFRRVGRVAFAAVSLEELRDLLRNNNFIGRFRNSRRQQGPAEGKQAEYPGSLVHSDTQGDLENGVVIIVNQDIDFEWLVAK